MVSKRVFKTQQSCCIVTVMNTVRYLPIEPSSMRQHPEIWWLKDPGKDSNSEMVPCCKSQKKTVKSV